MDTIIENEHLEENDNTDSNIESEAYQTVNEGVENSIKAILNTDVKNTKSNIKLDQQNKEFIEKDGKKIPALKFYRDLYKELEGIKSKNENNINFLKKKKEKIKKIIRKKLEAKLEKDKKLVDREVEAKNIKLENNFKKESKKQIALFNKENKSLFRKKENYDENLEKLKTKLEKNKKHLQEKIDIWGDKQKKRFSDNTESNIEKMIAKKTAVLNNKIIDLEYNNEGQIMYMGEDLQKAKDKKLKGPNNHLKKIEGRLNELELEDKLKKETNTTESKAKDAINLAYKKEDKKISITGEKGIDGESEEEKLARHNHLLTYYLEQEDARGINKSEEEQLEMRKDLVNGYLSPEKEVDGSIQIHFAGNYSNGNLHSKKTISIKPSFEDFERKDEILSNPKKIQEEGILLIDADIKLQKAKIAIGEFLYKLFEKKIFKYIKTGEYEELQVEDNSMGEIGIAIWKIISYLEENRYNEPPEGLNIPDLPNFISTKKIREHLEKLRNFIQESHGNYKKDQNKFMLDIKKEFLNHFNFCNRNKYNLGEKFDIPVNLSKQILDKERIKLLEARFENMSRGLSKDEIQEIINKREVSQKIEKEEAKEKYRNKLSNELFPKVSYKWFQRAFNLLRDPEKKLEKLSEIANGVLETYFDNKDEKQNSYINPVFEKDKLTLENNEPLDAIDQAIKLMKADLAYKKDIIIPLINTLNNIENRITFDDGLNDILNLISLRENDPLAINYKQLISKIHDIGDNIDYDDWGLNNFATNKNTDLEDNEPRKELLKELDSIEYVEAYVEILEEKMKLLENKKS